MRLAHRDVGFPDIQRAAHALLEQMSNDGLIAWTEDGHALVPTGLEGIDWGAAPTREPDDPDTPPSLRPPKNISLN